MWHDRRLRAPRHPSVMTRLMSLLQRIATGGPRRRQVPVEHDLEMLDGLDGCETAYLSLPERHALERLIDAGRARREVTAIIGTQVFGVVRLLPQNGQRRSGQP